MKKRYLLLIAFSLFAFPSLFGQVFKTVNVDTPGTLSEQLTAEELSTVTGLTVTGTINADDFPTMNGMPSLEFLYLTPATIVDNTIPPEAFLENRILKFIELPASVTLIGNSAFENCAFLNSIGFPASLQIIGDNAFVSTSLSVVHLPEQLKSIGSFAFSGNYFLNTVTFPASLEYIGAMAFVGCNSISEFYIPFSVSYIGISALHAGTMLEKIDVDPNNSFYSSESGVMFNKTKSTILHFPGAKPASNYTVPITTTAIGQNAFMDNTYLKSIVIPSSVSSIDFSAFYNCTGLDTITMNSPLPIDISADLFGQLNLNTCILMVPLGSQDDYRAATRWGSFVIIDGFEPWIYFSRYPIELEPGEGSSADLLVNSNYEWTATTNVDWLHVDSVIRIRDSFVHITANANPNGQKRTGYVIISGWGILSDSMLIDQQPAPPILELSTDSLSIGELQGSTSAFDIHSNTSWSVSSNQTWLHIIPDHGMNDSSVIVTADANPETNSREARLTVSGNGAEPLNIVVTQAEGPPVLNLSHDSLTMGAQQGSTATFTVSSNVLWTVISDEDWLHINPDDGNGNSQVLLTASANPDTVSRSAILTVSGLNVAATSITVMQDPAAFLEVSDDNLEIEPMEGSTLTFEIESNTSWTVSSDQSWLSANTDLGTDDALITLTAEINGADTSRIAIITIEGDDVDPVYITVTQPSITSGVGEDRISGIEIFMNRRNQLLTLTGAAGKAMKLFNLQGTCLMSRSLKSNNEYLDISHIPSGVYLIKVEEKTIKITK